MNRKIKTVIINDTSFLSHFGCKLVMKNLINLLNKYNFEIIDTFPVKEDWRNSKKIQKKILESDCVIVNGEGVIHDGKGEDLVQISEFCKKNNINSYLINSVYQNNPKSFKKYLELFNKIYVRESFSKIELSKIGIQSTVVPDLSLYTNFKINKITKDKNIGVLDSVNTTISTLSKQLKNVSFIPIYIFSQVKTNSNINILKNIKKNIFSISYGSLYFLKTRIICFKTERELLNELLRYKKFICGRFHGLMLLLLIKNPNFELVTSNSHKIEGVISDIGIQRKIYSSYSEIDLNKNINYNDDIKKIDAYVLTAKKKIKNMIQEIQEDLKLKNE